MAVERNRASPIHQAAVCGTGIDYQTLALRPPRTSIEGSTPMHPEGTERRWQGKITHPRMIQQLQKGLARLSVTESRFLFWILVQRAVVLHPRHQENVPRPGAAAPLFPRRPLTG